MLSYEEQLKLNDLIESIEDDYSDITEPDSYDLSPKQTEEIWQTWCEIWEYMERENNYTGSFGIKNDWMIINAVSDLEELLYYSGMYQELLQLSEQSLRISWNGRGESTSTRQNMYENAKLMMSEAYLEMGEPEKALEILRQHLDGDPLWGSGWIHYWGILYECKDPGYEEVLEKIYQGLKNGTPYRDKGLVADALANAFGDLQEEEKEDFCRTMSAYRKQRTVIKEPKIGRNDPCPCGSGKKYKKCCGR